VPGRLAWRIEDLGRWFRGDEGGWILVTVSSGWLLTFGTRIVYPALVPGMREEFGFGYAATGLVVGLIWAAYGATQLPGDLLADLVSERAALLAGLAITIGGILAVLLARDFGRFLVATAITGRVPGSTAPAA